MKGNVSTCRVVGTKELFAELLLFFTQKTKLLREKESGEEMDTGDGEENAPVVAVGSAEWKSRKEDNKLPFWEVELKETFEPRMNELVSKNKIRRYILTVCQAVLHTLYTNYWRKNRN